MSTSRDTIAYLLEQLEPLDVRARAMFGEYGLYCDGRLVGLVCDDRLLLKPSPASSGLAEEAAYPGSRPYRRVPDATVDDAAALQGVVAGTAAHMPEPRRR
ncbi:TfoX/Sxy family protein [Demequina maris]|uniref:TfoX/Sxy family protein n=1 Tax=Demequina maris TaxID=1638982 RepID=UPI0007809744|nr:TfoX/Sxy family protein [Demequina maris]